MTVTFDVSTEWTGQERTVTVHVHDTVEELRAEANAYHGSTVHVFEDAYGACNSFGDEVVIRFAQGFITAGILAHEVTHASMAIYALDVLCHKPYARASAHVRADNELIAYIVGDLTTRVNDQLHDLGYFK